MCCWLRLEPPFMPASSSKRSLGLASSSPVAPDVAVRNELAGVMLGAGKVEEAIALLPNLPADSDGLYVLARGTSANKDYESAEKESRRTAQASAR